MSPKISIIIPVLNEAANINAAVARAREVGDEVIVADGGSTDGTADIARSLDCIYCDSPRGRGQQLAAGAEVAAGDIFLFLHADNWLTPAARSQLVKAWDVRSSQQQDLFYGCFKQRISKSGFLYRAIEQGNYWRARVQKLPYGDQGIFVSRSIYDAVGGMPKIPLMEDFEFSQRVSRNGRIEILKGPLHVDARRWSEVGPIRQTLRNWSIALRYRMGVKPKDLVNKY